MNTAHIVKKTSEYNTVSVSEALKVLETSADGLTTGEAQQRLKIFGANEIIEKKRHPAVEFFQRYWSPMPWLLELAIALSLVLKHYLEAGIVFILLTVNAIIGQIESRGSQKALEALKKRLAVKARTYRDKNWIAIKASDLVPGDIISIGLGDIVPADAKIISGSLSVDQSVLTGESMLVKAEESDVIYSGSIVRRGEAQCLVVNTGADTYFGKTAELVKTARPKSHQEQIMLSIVRYMLFLGIVALVLVTVYAAISGAGFLTILTFAVIFLMGAVPVALPAVMTIVQAVGAVELAKKGVLVTRLASIEDAASIDILCLDKTGTITMNQLSVSDVVPLAPYTAEDVIITAGLASEKQGKDIIDKAVLSYVKDKGADLQPYGQTLFTPFEPSTRRTEAVIVAGGNRFKAVKGAPQTVLSLCRGLDRAAIDKINQNVIELSRKGYRTLGVAKSASNDLDDLQFMGLISMDDPPHPDSRTMIMKARELGVKPLMLTGDNLAIAGEIARRVGIGERIIRMEEFRKMDEGLQKKTIEEIDGLAEIYPEDKYQIVKLLQSRGHLVGMTGDGVNDAPALKQAEMGIAVSSSTDVAKAAASTILTRPGLAAIIDAVKTSRDIYQRMLTWVINKVTKVIQLVGLMTIGFFWFHDTVISLLGMALLLFANDFVTMSLATDNVKYTAAPNKWSIKNITAASFTIGLLFIIEGVIALVAADQLFHLGIDQLRTFVLLTLIFTSQFRVYIVRERRFFWSSRPGKALILSSVLAIVVFTLIGGLGIIVPAISLYQILFTFGLSAVSALAFDFPKYLIFKKWGL